MRMAILILPGCNEINACVVPSVLDRVFGIRVAFAGRGGEAVSMNGTRFSERATLETVVDAHGVASGSGRGTATHAEDDRPPARVVAVPRAGKSALAESPG